MHLRAAILVFAATALTGCGIIGSLSIFGGGDDDNNGGDNPPGLFGGDGGGGTKPCVNLCQQQVTCANGATTSLSGVVKDPAGKVPLYNVLVYVPNAPVSAITTGATCDRCGSVSGDPLVTTITDTAGHFQLDNVPVGDNIPLVVQVGKWRRQLVVPTVAKCVDTPLADADIRLPRNKSEGDIPQIALTTGGADVMECWLRKVGLDDSEFTTNASDGRVHFYAGSPEDNTTTAAFDGAHGGTAFPSATPLWSDKNNLLKYDIVIFSCEGDTFPATKPAAALQSLYDYTAVGGRVFASHWYRYWFDTSKTDNSPAGPPSPFEPFATFADRNDPSNPSNGTVNTSFPKGAAMHDWLGNVNALTNDKLPIKEPRDNVSAVDGTNATEWISITNTKAGNQKAVEYLSFNTPIPAPDDQKCGRVVYSDLHVSSSDNHGPAWPGGCKQADLSPQEKALEFMLFDLSSCIQSDKEPPAPPPVVK